MLTCSSWSTVVVLLIWFLQNTTRWSKLRYWIKNEPWRVSRHIFDRGYIKRYRKTWNRTRNPFEGARCNKNGAWWCYRGDIVHCLAFQNSTLIEPFISYHCCMIFPRDRLGVLAHCSSRRKPVQWKSKTCGRNQSTHYVTIWRMFSEDWRDTVVGIVKSN